MRSVGGGASKPERKVKVKAKVKVRKRRLPVGARERAPIVVERLKLEYGDAYGTGVR
jgi:hypothetical protein